MRVKTFIVSFIFLLSICFVLFCKSDSPGEASLQAPKSIKIEVQEGVDVTPEQMEALTKQILDENGQLSAWFAKDSFRAMGDYFEMKHGAITLTEPGYQVLDGVSEIERFFWDLKRAKSKELKEGEYLELEIETTFVFIEGIDAQIFSSVDQMLDRIDLVAHEYFKYYVRVKQDKKTISNSNGGGIRDFRHRLGCRWDV